MVLHQDAYGIPGANSFTLQKKTDFSGFLNDPTVSECFPAPVGGKVSEDSMVWHSPELLLKLLKKIKCHLAGPLGNIREVLRIAPNVLVKQSGPKVTLVATQKQRVTHQLLGELVITSLQFDCQASPS
jgi:hypothetical protein